jgi:predicted RNase H-like HicB family nuclease
MWQSSKMRALKGPWGCGSPDLPDCFSAGDDIDEALYNAQEALALYRSLRLAKVANFPHHAAFSY